jgi:hypothetical protein
MALGKGHLRRDCDSGDDCMSVALILTDYLTIVF